MGLKRRYAVEKVGGTVSHVDGGRVEILGSDYQIYILDFSGKDKKLGKISLSLGDVVWIYCVPRKNQVLTIFLVGEQDEPDDPDFDVEISED